jgi:hypothetical protein
MSSLEKNLGPVSMSIFGLALLRQDCQIVHGTAYQNWKNIPNGHKIYQHRPFNVPPKFTHILTFGLKMCHLATLD